MKNYLGNLIARHLNQAEVLQPRLASRFEPQPSVLQADADVSQQQIEADNFATRDAASAGVERTATEFPLVPDSDGPVTRQAVPLGRNAQTTFEASDAPSPSPAESQPSVSVDQRSDEAPLLTPELNEPAIVLTRQREKPMEQANSNIPLTQRAEGFPSTTPVAQTDAAEHVAVSLPVEHDRSYSTTKHLARAGLPPHSQIQTPSSIDLQPQVSATERVKDFTVPNSVSRPSVYNATPPEVHRDAEPAKSRHTEADEGVEQPPHVQPAVIPAPVAPKLPTVKSAEPQSPVSREARAPHQTQRAPFREMPEVSSPQTYPLNVRSTFAGEETAAEARPTVNVTIGRIEVRAATQIPEAQPQKQRREHQVLSLDEYLSQRSAGGR